MNNMKFSVTCLIDDGLLFEINRLVMHPVGRALVVTVPDDGTEPSVSVIKTEDQEGILFAPDAFAHGTEKIKQFMAREGFARHDDRNAILGFLWQSTPEQGEDDDVNH